MNRWKLRMSVLSLGCAAALLLAPAALTALGTTATESAAAQPTPSPASPERVVTTPAIPDKPAAAPQESADMEQQIRQWIEALSQEKEFDAWKGASWESYPLGPGTHSWVVHIRSGQEELGYLVVSSTEDGSFKLVEYGTGENPLFSFHTLYQSLVQRELIPNTLTFGQFIEQPPLELARWYVPPLQAVWQVEVAIEGQDGPIYFDAKTGEELPDVSSWIQPLSGEVPSRDPAPAPHFGATVHESESWEPTDPFVKAGWLQGEPLKLESFTDWKQAWSSQKPPVTYKGDLYGGLAIYPLAVSGYHVWSDSLPYVRLEHNGARYIPYEDAALLGGYYPSL